MNHHGRNTVEDETSQLNYIQDSDLFLTQKPYEVLSEVPPGLKKRNFELGLGSPEIIHDLRGQEAEFDLDRNGFQIVNHALETAIFNEETVANEYLPAVEVLLKSLEPGIDTYIFNWTLRSSNLPDPKPGTSIDLNDPMLRLKPVHAVHVDQSPHAAIKRARSILGDDPSTLDNKRIRVTKSVQQPGDSRKGMLTGNRSVWRPIRNAVENYPLAVCDGSTVPQEKLIQVDHVRKYYIGESLYPLQSASYRWYYLNRQTPDEVLLFKIFDSKENVQAKCK
ncbi:hypothetical protein ISF_09668 [Cordyceps fumosorosea ARSEF 2679]|uniref:Uncharacterized protein n=1 Tax=Cordyceps fumosorosea (strain ARSEF 2679) TaxID=1081104 RepID=A0A162JL16_CORFA|nr:hypothetical protein ISF_09668 [Cordyceps fumosorosea ARSEF 2679]OAA43583.1 hypothetical protein ISF_09668 [Cordyceps fumosorosea ARSEF 2679]